ncbi:MAG TPA: prepilin-type N-terminal cleavage/methylation domain-containing protein [Acidiferrobacter sp.]|nr:prepilin-type N-terminal cleavage/methylation domain-containing protein [Acidiferrobacter sp.]
MPTRPSAGFTLIEMVVAIVLTAILMAVAAPLIAHLVDSYLASVQGADLASAVGPVVSRMQWDSRNAYQIQVLNPCTLALEDYNGQILESYAYSGGQLSLNGALILGDLRSPGGCPFGTPSASSVYYSVPYDFVYAGPSGQGQFAIDGVLSAYAY